MDYQAHRGVSTECPENTLAAIQAAIDQGYQLVELDPRFTADGVCVLMHDSCVNRCCTDAQGQTLPDNTRVDALTFAQLRTLDAGRSKAYKFRGETVPMLSDALALAEKHAVTVKLDNRVARFTREEQEALFAVVRASSAQTAFTAADLAFACRAMAACPAAHLHYDGPVDEATLQQLRAITGDKPLTVWLPIKMLEEDAARLVKRYARLGVWTLSSEAQLAQAQALGADVIETNGERKPLRTLPGHMDCHAHTCYSHDGRDAPIDMARAMAEHGLAGFAVTDHCDTEYYYDQDVKGFIAASVQGALAAQPDSPVRLLTGVEIGEGIWYPQESQGIVDAWPYDVVLGSVHAVRYPGYTIPYAQIDFSAMTQTQIDEFMDVYFDDMLHMIRTCDFDILCHLTCPLRYIEGNYGRKVNLSLYEGKIRCILEEIIRRHIALEVNTARVGSSYDVLSPDEPILRLYRELGGYLITLGSDAHRVASVGNGLEEACTLLREIGFPNLYWYEKRIPRQYSLVTTKG